MSTAFENHVIVFQVGLTVVSLQAHFEDSQFLLNRADGRRLLKWKAIPTVFNVPNKPKLLTLKWRSPLEKQDDNVILTGCEDVRPPIKNLCCQISVIIPMLDLLQLVLRMVFRRLTL